MQNTYWTKRKEQEKRNLAIRQEAAKRNWDAKVAKYSIATVLPNQNSNEVVAMIAHQTGYAIFCPISIIHANGTRTLCTHMVD
jgi:hypothetical protein